MPSLLSGRDSAVKVRKKLYVTPARRTVKSTPNSPLTAEADDLIGIIDFE